MTPDNKNVVYNSAAVLGPDGLIGGYRKIHLPGAESNWATRGSDAMVFDTPWGPVGLAICYDVYCFPELIRYACAKGARLFINCTACCYESVNAKMTRVQLESHVLTNHVYLASANLVSKDKVSTFYGGSSIIGLDAKGENVVYFAGHPFDTDEGSTCEMYMATLDLSSMDRKGDLPLYETNPRISAPDWRPEIYEKLMTDIQADPVWRAKSARGVLKV